MWKNTVQTDRLATDDNIIRRMRWACWITKATDTHSEHDTYCFSLATMVMLRRLNVALYVHSVSCV